MTAERLKNEIKNVVCNPFNLIVLLTLVSLFGLIVIPLINMLQTTVSLQVSELRRIDGQVGDFTMYYWQRVLASELSGSLFWSPLKNSLLIGLCVACISVPLGGALSWLMVRSDMPGQSVISLLIMIPYMIPSWCKSLAWLTVFRNERSGGNLGVLAGLGLHIPDWLAYGPVAIILVMSMHYYAFAYIMISGSLRSINSELEEMAEIQGATKVQILKGITLPLVMPAVASSFIMSFSKSIGSYGVAATLGMRIGFYTLATKMHNCINNMDSASAYVIALLLIACSCSMIFLNQRFSGKRKSYATIGGKGGRSTPFPLGSWKLPISIFLIVFLFVAMAMPIFFLIMETFQIHTGKGYGLDNLTLFNWIGQVDVNEVLADGTQNYGGIFYNDEFGKAVLNTVKLTIVTSVITSFFGQLAGYISARGRGKWYGEMTEQLIFVPYLMPGVAFSAIYLAMFSVQRGPIPSLYATFALLVLVSVVKHLPFASRAGTANMLQISAELEEAADLAGSGFWRRMATIVIPLAKQGFLSGFMLIFISIAKELDLIILLMTPKQQTLSYLAFQYSRNVLPQQSDACAVCMLAFILIAYTLSNRLAGADIGKSWG